MFAARGYGRKNESKGRNGARYGNGEEETEGNRRKRERGRGRDGVRSVCISFSSRARPLLLAGARHSGVIELRYVRIRRSVCKRIASLRDFLLDVNTVSRALVHSPVHVHAQPGARPFHGLLHTGERGGGGKRGHLGSVCNLRPARKNRGYPRAGGSRRLTARDRR